MDNNQKPSQSSGSPESHPESSNAVSFRLPAWAKVAILGGIVALSSLGYFLGQKYSKPKTELLFATESDPAEIASRPVVDDFILTDADGNQKKLSDYRGKVVILSFWASWCAPCLLELPTFAELESKYFEHGLRVLAVNVDEGEEGVSIAREFWAKEKFQFPNFFDRQKQLAHKFEVEMLPSNFVIDKHGRLAFSSFGANDWSGTQTVEILENLLSEE